MRKKVCLVILLIILSVFSVACSGNNLKSNKEGKPPSSLAPEGDEKVQVGGDEILQEDHMLSMDEALTMLNSIDYESLGLQAELSEYKVMFDNFHTPIGDDDCYGIGVYSEVGGSIQNMGMFYTALNGSAVFKMDSLTGNYVNLETNEHIQPDGNISSEGLDQAAAEQLAGEKVDLNKYRLEPLQDLFNSDGQDYYVFKVYEQDNLLESGIAVSIKDGMFFCFHYDNTLSPYSDFPLYNEQKDAVYQWSGVYKNENGTINIENIDGKSFDFSICAVWGDMAGYVEGIARIHGNQAEFHDKNGFSLIFIMGTDGVVLKEDGYNSYAAENISFQGEYLPAE